MRPPILKGRQALVTDTCGGLGPHIARLLAETGAEVVLASGRLDVVEQIVTLWPEFEQRVRTVALKTSDPASVLDVLDAAQSTWGPPDLIVNNFGHADSSVVDDQSHPDPDCLVDANLKVAWLVAADAARRLIAARRSGSIINIAPIRGERPRGRAAALGDASLPSVMLLTRVLALGWASHGVRVNALAPGYLATELNYHLLLGADGERLWSSAPEPRVVKADKLGGAMLLLASDAGRHITGATLVVDVGGSARPGAMWRS